VNGWAISMLRFSQRHIYVQRGISHVLEGQWQ
jgi:hypothetical protein